MVWLVTALLRARSAVSLPLFLTKGVFNESHGRCVWTAWCLMTNMAAVTRALRV
jgi:hypothetical protein